MSQNISYVNSIFQQRWWLDVIYPNQWTEVVMKKTKKYLQSSPM